MYMYIYFVIIILHYFKLQVRISFTWYDAFDKGSLWGYRKSCKYNNIIMYIVRASDISRKKTQNFAGFSGANSRKNRPISRDFRRKKVKIRSQIG